MYGDSCRKLIPHCYNFGTIILDDFEDDSEDPEENRKFVIYYILRKYNMCMTSLTEESSF